MKKNLFAIMIFAGFLLFSCTQKKTDQPAIISGDGT